MSLFSIILLNFALLSCIGILIWAIVKEHRRPKWEKIYIYTKEAMEELDQENDYDEIILIYNSLKDDFKLSIEEATECVQNHKNEQWFRNKFWTK